VHSHCVRPQLPPLPLTPKDRIRGILAGLEDRWDGVSPEEQSATLTLLAELSADVRRREVERLKAG
jgi:hypothetical protein